MQEKQNHGRLISQEAGKKRTEKGADDEETTAPPPTIPYEPAKERKEEKRNRFLKRQEQQKASVHCSLKMKTNVQSKTKRVFKMSTQQI